MSYKHIKAICLFCGTAVEGDEEYMLGGRRYDGKGGRPEKWIKEKPEHKWQWNGLTSRCADGKERSAVYYLCPNHQTDEDFKKAFEWAQHYSERVPLATPKEREGK